MNFKKNTHIPTDKKTKEHNKKKNYKPVVKRKSWKQPGKKKKILDAGIQK